MAASSRIMHHVTKLKSSQTGFLNMKMCSLYSNGLRSHPIEHLWVVVEREIHIMDCIAIRRWYTVVIKGWTWSAKMLRQAVAFKRCSIGIKGPKAYQENTPHHYTTTTSLNRWEKAGWIHAFMLFMPNSDSTSECRSRNQDSSDQATFFQSSIVQFRWACANCSLCFLFLADRSGTRCGLLLL